MGRRLKLRGYLNRKLVLNVRDESNMEVRWRIRTTPLRAMLTLALAFLLTFSTAIFVVAKFSASSFADVLSYRGLKEEFLRVHALADSLHERIRVNELYIENAKRLLAGQEKRNLDWSVRQGLSGPTNLRPQDHHPSSVVGLLTSSIQVPSPGGYRAKPRVQDLVRPIDGIITHKFSRQGAHLGIDLVADMRTPIHSVADGVILFSQWTLDGGNTMAIQHLDGLVFGNQAQRGEPEGCRWPCFRRGGCGPTG